MAKYSSDSDSDYSGRYRRKYRKSRSSSSDSSDSSSHRRRSLKHSKSKHRHHSHSRSGGRDRNSRNYRSGRSHSRDKERRRYRSSRGRSHSSDRSKKKVRSTSREKSRSRSSSLQPNVQPNLPEKSQTISSKDDFPIEPRFKEDVLTEINSEGFTPKQFSSSQQMKESKFKNIVIDITADTIHVPVVNDVPNGPESIFHSSIMVDQELRFDKWVKKLYTLRQKAIVDLAHTNVL